MVECRSSSTARQAARLTGASTAGFATMPRLLSSLPRSLRASPEQGRLQSGARSGALLAAASGVSIVGAYAFLLAAGRLLGSDAYGSLAALLGLLAIVLIPAGALQMAVSREVSRLVASGDPAGPARLARGMLRASLIATAPLLVVGLALAGPLSGLLHIHSVAIVVLAVLTLSTALVFPLAMGVLQGQQRFPAVATLYVVPWVLRLVLLAVFAAAGYRLGGAVFATLVGAVGATVLALVLIREPLRGPGALSREELMTFLRYLSPVAVGLVGIALLTHVDILIVKARFSGDEAGAYAAASAFARVGFFLPATILAVLFPRTAARQARGEETEDILGRSLLATAVFCGLLVLFYAAAGPGLVATTFGHDFAEGGRVLAPFALAIGLFSIANVLVGYHLSRGETRYAWIVAGGVVVQVAVLASLPTSLRGVVWTNVGIGAALLVVHELTVRSSIPALRAGLRHFSRSFDVRLRSVGVEAGIVLLSITAFVCLLFLPMVASIGSTVIGRGSDASGTVWWFYSLQHEGGYHLFGQTHHTLTGAPFGWDGDNGLNIQWLLPYYPAYLATKVVGEVAAHNLVLLTGYIFSGAAMYALVRYLGCARLVAAWAALVYIVFPWHLERTPHASLTHLEFLPLLLLAMVAAARSPSLVRFAGVGVVALACWLTSGYFGAMALVGVAAFALGIAFSKARRRFWFLLIGSTAATLGASALVAVLSAVAGVGRGSGLHRVASDLHVYGLRPLELVVPAAGNFLFGHWTGPFLAGRQHFSNPAETTNYLGVVTLGLALTWLVHAWRRRATLPADLRLLTPGFLAVVAISLLLALPSPVTIFGHNVWMPSRLLWQVLPPFRVPSRWVVLAMAALVPLAALTLQAAVSRLSTHPVRWRRTPVAPVALVAAAMLLSFLELGENPSRSRFNANDVPPEYAALSRAPAGDLVDYPLFQDMDRLFWQRKHGRPVLNSEAFGTAADDARKVLTNPRTPGTAEQLALLGVTAIVTHVDALRYSLEIPDVPNANWGPGYSLLARTPDGSSTWRVTASPAPALVTLPGFAGPNPLAQAALGFLLDSPSGVAYIGFRSKEAQVVRLVFDAAPPKNATRVLRLADDKKEMPFTLNAKTQIAVLVAIPRGYSLILAKTDPPATSDANAIVLSNVRAERGSGEPALHGLPEAADPGF
jgi:O-antigen/teichoic acid export membrane protein